MLRNCVFTFCPLQSWLTGQNFPKCQLTLLDLITKKEANCRKVVVYEGGYNGKLIKSATFYKPEAVQRVRLQLLQPS